MLVLFGCTTASTPSGEGDESGDTETGADGGEQVPWGEGEVEACELTPTDNPLQALSWFDTGYPRLDPVDGECAPGTQPAADVECEDVFPCVCEYACADACGERGICVEGDPDNVCACHPSYVGEPGACEWDGLHPNLDWDAGCDEWEFHADDVVQSGMLEAEVVGGRLHLVAVRCTGVYAFTPIRVPDDAEFPSGAALRFEYTATVEGELEDDPQHPSSTFLRIDNGSRDLPFTAGGPESVEVCVDVGPKARLQGLGFAVEGPRTCLDLPDVEIELWVGDVRIVDSAACG